MHCGVDANRHLARCFQSIALNESKSTRLECTLTGAASFTFRLYFSEFDLDEKLRRDLAKVSDEQKGNREMVENVQLEIRARINALETQISDLSGKLDTLRFRGSDVGSGRDTVFEI